MYPRFLSNQAFSIIEPHTRLFHSVECMRSKLLRFAMFALALAIMASEGTAATNPVPFFLIQKLELLPNVFHGKGLLINNRGQVAAVVSPEDALPRLVLHGKTKTTDFELPLGSYRSDPIMDLNWHGTVALINYSDYSALLYRHSPVPVQVH